VERSTVWCYTINLTWCSAPSLRWQAEPETNIATKGLGRGLLVCIAVKFQDRDSIGEAHLRYIMRLVLWYGK